MTNLIALPSGTELAGDYRIDRVLGAGGFGVTYLADEMSLSRAVTIKEYFPSDFAARTNGLDASPRSQDCAGDYKWGLDRFIAEAQTLAKFDHRHIVKVYRTFKANNTAYMVLQWEEGQSLKSWLKTLGRAPRQKELDRIIAPLLDALETIHKADFLHRDIAPDNIIIRKSGDPVLIDFGAARGDIAAHSKTKTVSALVKPGYSPYEQYAETSKQQGPWTDIYAFAATLYHAVTGKRPLDSPSRMLNDDMVPAAQAALSSYRSTFLDAIDRGLALGIDARPQSVAAWRGALLAPEPKKPSILARMRESNAGKTEKAAREKADPKAVTLLGAAATAVPPPPDTPAPKGTLLDFVDALKQPAKQVAQAPPPPAKAKAAGSHAADPKPSPRKAATLASAKTPKATAKVNTRAIARLMAPQPQISDGRRARPAPDVPRERHLTRGLRTKVIIAAGFAGALIAFQDQIPRLLVQPHREFTTGAIAPVLPERNIIKTASFKAHDGAVSGLSLSGDGRLIVTTSNDRTLRIWERESLKDAGAIYMDDGPATSLSVRNNRALTTHADGSTVIWDLDTRQRLYRFKRNDASVWAATFAGSEDRVASAGHDWTVALWETASESAPARLFEGHESAVQALASDASGRWLASGGADKTVKLWDLETRQIKRTYRNHSDFVSALAVSPDSNLVAAASLDGSIKLWSTTSSRPQRTYTAHKARVTSIAFSANGELLVSAAEDGTVRIRGLKRTRSYWALTLNGMGQGARTVAFAPDGRSLITGGQDGVVTLWVLPEPALAQN